MRSLGKQRWKNECVLLYFMTKLQDARIIIFFSASVLPCLCLPFFLPTLTCLCLSVFFRRNPGFSTSLFLSLCTVCVSAYVHASVCLLWCDLQFRTLKQSKIPVGEETQVQSAGGMTTETSWCWQTCPSFSLSLSSPSGFLSYFPSIFISSALWFFFFWFIVNVHIKTYLHLWLPPPTSLSSTGRAVFLLAADVVLLPVWASQWHVGGPSCRAGQGRARPGAVGDVRAAGAKICRGPRFI